MKVIWKFTLRIDKEQIIELVEDAKILSIQSQFGNICMWVLLNTHNHKIKRKFRIIGTGHEIDDDFYGEYIDTCLVNNYVWHVFDCGVVK